MNTLECYAIIDFSYWRIKEITEKLEETKSQIAVLVDNTCEHDEMKEIQNEVRSLFELIIDSKKKIGEDYSAESKYLEEIKTLY